MSIGLIWQKSENPPSNLFSQQDPPFDLLIEELKTYCDIHQEGPTLGCITIGEIEGEFKEEDFGRIEDFKKRGPIGLVVQRIVWSHRGGHTDAWRFVLPWHNFS